MRTSESPSDRDSDAGSECPHLPVIHLDPSQAMPTSSSARAKRRIAALEEELEMMRQERGGKQRKTIYYVAQGRAIRRMVCLYTSLEDLIAENDRRYEHRSEDVVSTLEYVVRQNRMQRGYIELMRTLPWLHEKLGEFEHEESEEMLRKLKKGADAAHGDDTSSLKELVSTWVNEEFRPSPLIKPNDKQLRSFTSDVCGKLLCPAEWDWNDDRVKAGIRDRTSDYIVSENSWPMFTYENYKINRDNLEEGFLKSKLLVLAFKAIFTSPSSAKEVDGDGDGADLLENTRRARRKSDQTKVKTCVHFALSSVSSWRTMDGDFDYEAFWNSIVDFFEDVPGPVAQRRMSKLLEWWTRKIFGTSHREDLTPDVVLHMSVNTLAQQRRAMEDAAFDSD
ncbi:hypothetical protein BD769DRAFT_1364158 [Suillus cothurnatus]|nr:hypothetical protein BD769DRAFT_1364158 [Suillus cothurnatus]